MKYAIDYFIKKFKAIPSYRWCTEHYHSTTTVLFNLITIATHCAQGFCTKPTLFEFVPQTEELLVLRELFQSANDSQEGRLTIGRINNGEDERYQQRTPKARVLAALYDLKREQQVRAIAAKEKTVYVTVDQPVRNLAKAEFVMN